MLNWLLCLNTSYVLETNYSQVPKYFYFFRLEFTGELYSQSKCLEGLEEEHLRFSGKLDLFCLDRPVLLPGNRQLCIFTLKQCRFRLCCCVFGGFFSSGGTFTVSCSDVWLEAVILCRCTSPAPPPPYTHAPQAMNEPVVHTRCQAAAANTLDPDHTAPGGRDKCVFKQLLMFVGATTLEVFVANRLLRFPVVCMEVADLPTNSCCSNLLSTKKISQGAACGCSGTLGLCIIGVYDSLAPGRAFLYLRRHNNIKTNSQNQ